MDNTGKVRALSRQGCLASIASIAKAATAPSTNTTSSKAKEFASEPPIPPPLVTGRDLIALGWKPGPHFGPILEAVQTAQLEGTLTTPEEALACIKAKHPTM